MPKLIDRLLIISYVKSYMICLTSLLGLYIIVDLFMNIDDFARIDGGFWGTMQHIGRYYFHQSTYIFDRLSEAIVLLAAMFTVAWVQRNNELLPMLSAGVSTRRFLTPVLSCTCVFVLINVANQEMLIPALSREPIRRDDPKNEKPLIVHSAFDSNSINFMAKTGIRKDLKMIDFKCSIPSKINNGTMVNLHSETAYYKPPDTEGMYAGGWLLLNTKPEEIPNWKQQDLLQQIDPGKYFLKTTEIDFDTMTRKSNWYQNESTWAVFHSLGKGNSQQLAKMAVFFHMRLTRPILGMILVFMGLSVILRDQNRNVFISAGFCLVLCGLFFAAIAVAKYCGDEEFLSPALAAWLPVFIFGPLAFVLYDAVHT